VAVEKSSLFPFSVVAPFLAGFPGMKAV